MAPGSSTETVGDNTEVEIIFVKNPKNKVLPIDK